MKIISALFACTAAILLVGGATQAADVLGLVKEKPAQGPYVETDRGYMIPYTTKLPGSDVTMEMIPIPGGVLTVGSPQSEKGRTADEGPQFQVKIDPLWVGKTEVNWAQYKEFMKLYDAFKRFQIEGVRKITDDNKADAITAPTKLYEPDFTFEYGERPEQAAVTMTQYAAKQYTKWLSLVSGNCYRLPTEAEWEYAARAGTTTAYSFGDDPAKLGDYGWCKDNIEEEGQQNVGQKKPNPWGLYDMHGNAWEWTLDAYSPDGYGDRGGKSLSVWEAVAWPTKPYPRTVRGGSWEFGPDRSRSAARLGSHDPDWKEYDPNLPLSPWWFTTDPARGVGFRVVRQLDWPDAKLREKLWEIDCEDTR
ncbi:MAG: formylglycine-generating enzyme family protein, partial [Planctomycetales bacterium]|nr:formylglycine-generating enzyme family protein [Planctomycetales bacterium]